MSPDALFQLCNVTALTGRARTSSRSGSMKARIPSSLPLRRSGGETSGIDFPVILHS